MIFKLILIYVTLTEKSIPLCPPIFGLPRTDPIYAHCSGGINRIPLHLQTCYFTVT